MELSIAFSPCPNDTFIFDALVNAKIDTEGIVFKPVLEDVQTLNLWALEGKMDISKVSYGVLPQIINEYELLNSGGALGKGVGPLLIAKRVIPISELNRMRIAIPGENTTAHLLFSYAFPQATNKDFFVFKEIENAVLDEKVDAGVIIHENRFTYQDKGLVKLTDLGELWESKTSAPIPLGGIVAKKTIDRDLRKQVDKLIRKSLEYSFANYPRISDYVSSHSQEMNEAVMRNHIDLYVNDFSLDLGEQGHQAVETFMNVYRQIHG